MLRPKATIHSINERYGGLLARKVLLEKNGYEALETCGIEEGLRSFFTIWLEQWKKRNQVSK